MNPSPTTPAAQHSPTKRAAKPLLFRLLTLTLAIALTLALAELALRLLMPGYLPSVGHERHFFCQFDPKLGWIPRPNVQAQHDEADFSVHVEQNALGLRGPSDMQLAKSPGTRRVVVLGDSYVWGYGVNQNQVFSDPAVHQQPHTEFINLGVSGYGTDQQALFYSHHAKNFQNIDHVVLAITIYNDIQNNTSSHQYGYAKPYYTLTDGTLTLHDDHIAPPSQLEWNGPGWFNALRSRLMILNLVDRAMRASKADRLRNSPLDDPADQRLDQLVLDDPARHALELTAQIIAQLNTQVAEDGARFSVVIIPYKPHVELNLPVNHPFAAPLQELLAARGIRCIEPYEQFRSAQATGTRLFNNHDNHFSPQGHQLFARVILDAIDQSTHAPTPSP